MRHLASSVEKARALISLEGSEEKSGTKPKMLPQGKGHLTQRKSF